MKRYNPNNATDRKKLHTSINQSKSGLKDFCDTRLNHLELFVGHHYGKNFRKKTYLNLLNEAVMVYTRHLAARNPTCLVVTPHAHLRGVAKDMQEALNHQLKEINFGTTMQKIVLEAMFSMGVAKMGVTPEERHGVKGYLHDANQTFVDSVTFDKFVYDIGAETMEAVDFMGDFYELPTDYIKRSKMFNRKSRHMADASSSRRANEYPPGAQDSGKLTGKSPLSDGRLKKRTRLVDVWLPGEGLFVTLLRDQPEAPPLRVMEWEGPERGPYHTLGFTQVPGNVQPLAPATLWSDLHSTVNAILRKVIRSEKNRKKLGMTTDEHDAIAINQASDQQTIEVGDLGNFVERTFGGADGDSVNLMQGLKEMFSRGAGNIEILAGMGAESETLGQDRILNANANERVRDMQDQVVLFIQRVIQEMAWYLWDDPLVNIPITRMVGDVEIQDTWTAASQEGDFFDYNFEFEPHSLRSMSPQERLLQFQGILGNFVMPAMPSFEAQGYSLNIEEYMSVIAELSGIHELTRVITSMEGEVPQRPNSPHTGDHVYTRMDKGPGRGQQQDAAAQAFSQIQGSQQQVQ